MLARGRDFELLPEPVWKSLSSWYGGSPALPRTVSLRSCYTSCLLPLNYINYDVYFDFIYLFAKKCKRSVKQCHSNFNHNNFGHSLIISALYNGNKL